MAWCAALCASLASLRAGCPCPLVPTFHRDLRRVMRVSLRADAHVLVVRQSSKSSRLQGVTARVAHGAVTFGRRTACTRTHAAQRLCASTSLPHPNGAEAAGALRSMLPSSQVDARHAAVRGAAACASSASPRRSRSCRRLRKAMRHAMAPVAKGRRTSGKASGRQARRQEKPARSKQSGQRSVRGRGGGGP
jgi:hypothetical protein